MTAFDEGLVDESVITRKYVDKLYDEAGESPEEEPDYRWLDVYREDYAAHARIAESPAARHRRHATDQVSVRGSVRRRRASARIPATAPIRNTGPKMGRNDPCWCGSGKKYKKCHLGRNRPHELRRRSRSSGRRFGPILHSQACASVPDAWLVGLSSKASR